MARGTPSCFSPLLRWARSTISHIAPPATLSSRVRFIAVIALVVAAALLSTLVASLSVRRRPSRLAVPAAEVTCSDGEAAPTPLAGAEPFSLSVPQLEGFPCEEAYAQRVRFHVVIPLPSREHFARVLKNLGALGLTGADVYGYVRTPPPDCWQARVTLPCGMRFHERLLLPNVGEEGAVLMSHVASVYDDLPDAVMLLHGAFQSWHSLCSILIRRARAVYRGLGEGPAATPAMRAFARQAVTLNACKAGYNLNNCCGTLLCGPREAEDEPSCPWERVGIAPSSLQVDSEWPVALCQLRDRTPASNWTVLSSDAPEFFMRQRQILLAYEADPEQRVPITHPRMTPVPALDAAAKPRRLHAAPERAPASGPGPAGRSAPEQASGALNASRGEPLQNVRDMLFPWAKFTAKLKHTPSLNYHQYGLEKFWQWMLKYHNLPGDSRPLRPGETPRRWCCLQFIAPKRVLQRAPKGWWEDVAWLMTHTGWKPMAEWPAVLGQLTEYNFWRALGLHYDTLDEIKLYVDVERDMGPDEHAGTCIDI